MQEGSTLIVVHYTPFHPEGLILPFAVEMCAMEYKHDLLLAIY